ncbi:MAG: peptidylprolyl isomerase [Pseudomonadota bacterium]
MKSIKAGIVAFSLVFFGMFAAAYANSENTMIITLKDGEVVINLREDLAPQHVARIKELVRNGEYDNVAFHRVIPGFMAQTGDVQFGDMGDSSFSIRRAGTGGSDKPDLPAEFTNARYLRGVVGMARSQNPNSANSQFFIMFDAGEFLNGQYTVVGEVASGMEFVDNIKKGSQANNGAVRDPDRMIKVEIAADR